MPCIPVGTSMAEMERIKGEELDAIRNNTWRVMVVLPHKTSPYTFQPNLPLDYWVCRCRFTVGPAHRHMCAFCEYCSTHTHEYNKPWDMHHPDWTQRQWDEREEWLFLVAPEDLQDRYQYHRYKNMNWGICSLPFLKWIAWEGQQERWEREGD